MTEDNIELSRRKILAGLGAVGAAGAGAGLGTSAYFNDEESFDGNSVTAGDLDLFVHYTFSADQGGVETENLGEPTTGTIQGDAPVDGGDAATVGYELADVKPGDSGGMEFCFSIVDNPAYLWLCGAITENAENGYNEPEPDTEAGGDVNDSGDADGDGELADVIEATLYYASGGSEGDEIASGTLRELLDSGVALDGDGDGAAGVEGRAPFEGGGSAAEPTDETCVYLEWEVPVEVGNEIQTDSLAFDLTFHAEQSRHNDGTEAPCEVPVEGSCDCPESDVDTAASQSPEVTVDSTDASAFPQVSTFLTVDTPSGNAGDLTAADFALAEDGCGQSVDVQFTSEDKPVDFVFLMDVTGSMGGELSGVQDEVSNFVSSVEGAGIDARYALYLYGDDDPAPGGSGTAAVYLKQDFTSDGGTFDDAVQNTSLEEQVGYGGDGPEDNYEAILTADNDLAYRAGSQRVMIDVTDAPGEEDPGKTVGGLAETRENAVSVLNDNDYTYIAVSEDLDGQHEKKPLAQNEADDGMWIQLGTDFEPILGVIEDEVATSYRVRYTTACPQADGSTRAIVIAIEDPAQGTLYATTSYAAPS